MRMKQKSSYWRLLLAGILVAGAAVSGIGVAQARYTTVAGWQVQLQQPTTQVQLVSSVMDANGSTVVLEDLYVGDERELKVDVEVINGTATGTLYCTPSNKYLTATCEETIDNASYQDFTIVLTPTEAAQELTAPTPTTVKVEWNETLWAQLQVTLLPREEAAQDNTEPIDTLAEEGVTGPTQVPVVDVPPTAENFLNGMQAFDPDELLALQIAVPEGCDGLEITRNGSPFPAFTRYSTDGGEGFTLLYDGGAIDLIPNDAQSIVLLLDFADATLSQDPMTVTAQAYYDGVSMGTASVITRPSEDLPAMDSPQAPIIVTAQSSWSIEIPQSLPDTQVTYHLRRLDGSEDALAMVSIDESGQLTIWAVDEDNQAKAGTYLLDIMWNYQNVTVARRQLTFYVNYSAYVQPSNTKAAEETTEASTTGGNES